MVTIFGWAASQGVYQLNYMSHAKSHHFLILLMNKIRRESRVLLGSICEQYNCEF